ncbi:MAG: hypothetical protein A2V86_02660 [Deltaproteobacteria bacterium RBG_16_49_23]|nr:MAG: hypothetical protein A2V86_02660 [Deltaproteobacteria bacterium RBG_16_49_23]
MKSPLTLPLSPTGRGRRREGTEISDFLRRKLRYKLKKTISYIHYKEVKLALICCKILLDKK